MQIVAFPDADRGGILEPPKLEVCRAANKCGKREIAADDLILNDFATPPGTRTTMTFAAASTLPGGVAKSFRIKVISCISRLPHWFASLQTSSLESAAASGTPETNSSSHVLQPALQTFTTAAFREKLHF